MGRVSVEMLSVPTSVRANLDVFRCLTKECKDKVPANVQSLNTILLKSLWNKQPWMTYDIDN